MEDILNVDAVLNACPIHIGKEQLHLFKQKRFKKKSVIHAVGISYTLLSLLLGQLCTQHLSAQSIQYEVEHITSSQGLPATAVYAIHEDDPGFLWLGTDRGLFRFDGISYKAYPIPREDSAGRAGNHVLSIQADSQGNLWLGTQKGLSYFDLVSESFETHAAEAMLSIFHSAEEGVVYCATETGLKRFLIATHTFEDIPFPEHELLNQINISAREKVTNQGFNHDNGIHGLYKDRQGTVWAGVGWGFRRYSLEKNAFKRYIPDSRFPVYALDDWPQSKRNAVGPIIGSPEKDSILWIGSRGGLIRFNTNIESIETYYPNGKEALEDQGPVIQHVTALHHGKSQTFWVGNRLGIFTFDTQLNQFSLVTSLHQDLRVYTLYEDHNGTLWVGASDGLRKIFRAPERFTVYAKNENTSALFANAQHGIIEDDEGNILIGAGNGLIRFNPSNDSELEWIDLEKFGLTGGTISSLFIDTQRNLWIGRSEKGVVKLDPETESIRIFEYDPNDSTSIGNGHVQHILEDKDGKIWIALIYEGLDRYDPVTNQITHFKHDPRDNESLGDVTVVRLYIPPSSPQHLWLATLSGPIRYHLETSKFEYFTPRDMGQTWGFVEDSQGRLWAGTSTGLYQFDRSAQAFSIVVESTNQPWTEIFSLQADNQGKLWLGTNNGLSRYDPQFQNFNNYTAADGIPSNIFREGGFLKSSSGELFFKLSGDAGWISFFPENVLNTPNPPSMALTGLDFQGFPASVAPESPLNQSIIIADHLVLPHDQNELTFYYAGLKTENPAELNYQYMLEGFDEQWVDGKSQRFVRYNQLPPGKYTFNVRGAVNNGIWGQPRSLAITINPPWWRTSLGYAVYVLLLVGSISVANRFQRNRLVAKEREVARIREAQLIAEAADERARLAEKLEETKSRFFVNLSHEFRTPLTLLLGPIRDALDGAVGESFHRQLASMHRNGERLHQLINQLLDLAKLESGGLHLQARESNLVAFVRALTLSFASRSEREQKKLQFETHKETLNVFFDRDKLEKIVFNLLSNAFKFTSAGDVIRILIDQTKTEATIIISDTGEGIPAKELPHIFNRFHQADSSLTRKFEGSGIGLALSKELVELHHGQIQAESEPGAGSTFTVFLPLGRSHLRPQDLITEEADDVEINAITDSVDTFTPQPKASNGAEPVNDKPKASPAYATILIVEDNADVRAYLKSHLGNYNIEEAVNGVQGLQKAQAIQPDLIISDVMMPEMDGLALCQTLKQNKDTQNIPVVLLTAKAAEENKIDGLSAGADDYLYKPFSAKELLARTENLIYRRKQLRKQYSQEIVLKPSDIVVSSENTVFIEKITAIVDANLGESQFNAERLAEEAGLSRRQLQRRIKQLLQKTPTEFIRDMRLERAAFLLKHQTGNVSEIMYQVGYRDLRHFSRLFKQKYGSPPSLFSNQNNNL